MVDSLDVKDGETMEVAFVADNPGIWMDHCHNLTHAAQGLVAHLMYSGVTAPYRLGDDSGNEPEARRRASLDEPDDRRRGDRCVETTERVPTRPRTSRRRR